MREIKFRGKRQDNGEWVYGYYLYTRGRFGPLPIIIVTSNDIEVDDSNIRVDYNTVGQFTGLKDKNGKEIYEGDIIRFRRPYRSTQTHTGDNIPNGSYTEPMEPEIETTEDVVIFGDGMFCLEERNSPLVWFNDGYDEEGIIEAIKWRGNDLFDWKDPTEGELSYLLETYKLKDLNELIQYVSGIEIIGNIHDNPKLIS